MIVLDTNIISEFMKSQPQRNVINWIDQEEVTELFITTITIAEISYGINSLPNGNRRQNLEIAFNKTIKESFKHRVLFFDEAAAHCYGDIMSKRKKLGKPLNSSDGQIAAIVLTQEANLATRNMRDFSDCGINVINPFELA